MKPRIKRELTVLLSASGLTFLICLFTVPMLSPAADAGDIKRSAKAAKHRSVEGKIEHWFLRQTTLTNIQVKKLVKSGRKANRIATFVEKRRMFIEKVSEQWRKQLERYVERLERRLETARDKAKRAVAMKKNKAAKKKKAAKAPKEQAGLKVTPLPLERVFAGLERDAKAQFNVYKHAKANQKPHEAIERVHNRAKKSIQSKVKSVRKALRQSLKLAKRGHALTMRSVREALKRRRKQTSSK